MGVPVVTMTGPTLATRMSASVLTQVGLDAWIATTEEQYVQIAARLAADMAQLVQTRSDVRGQMKKSVLCDGEKFTRHLEEVYRNMWRRWCDGARAAA